MDTHEEAGSASKWFARAPRRAGGDSTKWARYAGRDIIPAWVADIDFPAAPAILEAMQKRLDHGVFGYSDPMPEVAETAIAYFERRWGWRISPEWIVFLPGVEPAINAVCRMAEGGDVITPSPIYHVFRRAPMLAGANRVDSALTRQGDSWEWPQENLEAAVSPRSRVLQLCNPHNPGGHVFSRAELLRLGEFCLRRGLILFADEVHADLILDEDKTHVCAAALSDDIARISITLQSPSKAFNVAGLNFAVAVIPDKDLRARFEAALAGKVITHLNPFGMAAAAAAWGGQCDLWLEALIAHLRRNRDRLSAAVKTMRGIEMPHLAATYLAWLHTPGLSPEDFEKGGVGMSSGGQFGGDDFMRLNFGCDEPLLEDIIARMQKICG